MSVGERNIEEPRPRRGSKRRMAAAGGRMSTIVQPAFLKADAPLTFTPRVAPDHRVDGFRIEKQITFDLCWAAVAVSAGRFRGVAGVPKQSAMVDAYIASNLQDCPCSARPGDNGLLLWCVDCACQLVRTRCTQLGSAPGFDALCTTLDAQSPVCVLRDYSTGAHYVVIVGSFVSSAGVKMVTIADPARGQPDERDIAYRELFEGDGKVIAAYRL